MKKPRLKRLLPAIHRRLLDAFGRQHWWPGDTPFEVMVGAVLTQNTSWGNVERAIARLKRANLMDPHRLAACPDALLSRLIRPVGYFNVKTRRLRSFLEWLHPRLTNGVVQSLRATRTPALRRQLLEINGVGPETADSILLYALRRKVFVVDAYTRRFLTRHKLIPDDAGYEDVRALFEGHLPRSAPLYNEYHALIVRLGNETCRPRPACDRCPLRRLLNKPHLK